MVSFGTYYVTILVTELMVKELRAVEGLGTGASLAVAGAICYL
jgi:hypothetical protein